MTHLGMEVNYAHFQVLFFLRFFFVKVNEYLFNLIYISYERHLATESSRIMYLVLGNEYEKS